MMEDKEMEELIVDYVDGKLEGELLAFVQKAVEKESKWQNIYDQYRELALQIEGSPSIEVPSQLRSNFEEMLASAIDHENASAVSAPFWSIAKVAASVSIVVALTLIGLLIRQNFTHQQELAALKSEVILTRQIVLSSLGNQISASRRLQGINTSLKLEAKDDQIVEALFSALAEDDNTNVRLAALEGLSRFVEDPMIKVRLISALETQHDPVVSIRLINLMVKLKLTEAVEPLQRMIDDQELRTEIRDEAYLGVMKLS